MARPEPITRKEALRLRKAVAARAADAAKGIAQALERPLGTAAAIRELHDSLLFLEAHPASASDHALARKGLRIMRRRLQERLAADERLRAALQDSGVAGCDAVGAYSYPLVRWLLRNWRAPVSLEGAYAEGGMLMALLRPLLTPAEQEAADQGDGDAMARLEGLFGSDQAGMLRGLTGTLERARMDPLLREGLFAACDPYVRIAGGARVPSLTALRFPSEAPFVDPGPLLRNADVPAALGEAVAPPIPLGPARQRRLIATARQVLALMQRETDPVTHAQAAELHAMGRGLAIALFHMDPAHRLSLESYVGFMAFKNGVPMAYGGAWVFPGRTKVGINVFPALRGGESAWFFAQLLRLYRQRFRVPLFEAENYQLGHGNPDGLRSGAFWFYYRLGFRPWDERLARIAAREAGRLRQRPGYRVPLAVLKELVADGLALRVQEDPLPMVDTAALVRAAGSLAATDRLRVLGETRAKACRALGLADDAANRPALDAWALPLALAGDYERWPLAERARMAKALALRSAPTEHGYQEALRCCTRLLQAWAEAARRAG